MAFYCSNCGKELEDGTRYCSTCGFDTMAQGSGNKSSSASSVNDTLNNSFGGIDGASGGMGGTLTIIFVLGLIWVLISALYGIYCLTVGGVFFFFGGPFLIVIGVLSFVSAICAIICCLNIYKLEKFQQTSTLLLIGSILALITSILGGILGIVFYFLLKNEKHRFRS